MGGKTGRGMKRARWRENKEGGDKMEALGRRMLGLFQEE